MQTEFTKKGLTTDIIDLLMIPTSGEIIIPIGYKKNDKKYKFTSLEPIEIYDEDFSYEIGTFEGNEEITKVIIQEGIEDIGNQAFENCINLTSITIPEGVKRIGDYAFRECESLTEIILPKSLEHIGYQAFAGCKNLSKIIMPKNANINVQYDSFEETPWLETRKEDLIIEGDTLISGKYAFGDVEIPENIKNIAIGAFIGNHNITSVTIPEGVTTLRNGTFLNCTELADITIPKSLVNIEYNVFMDTPWLNTKREENPLVSINNILIDAKWAYGEVTIPDDIYKISIDAFSHSNIENITIPNSVTNIENSAFNNCAFLKSINIPSSVTNIGKDVFTDCKELKEVIWDSPIPLTQELMDNLFEGCYNLETIIYKGTKINLKIDTLEDIINRASIADSTASTPTYEIINDMDEFNNPLI